MKEGVGVHPDYFFDEYEGERDHNLYRLDSKRSERQISEMANRISQLTHRLLELEERLVGVEDTGRRKPETTTKQRRGA